MRPPRYDEVFEEGTSMLDAIARGEIEEPEMSEKDEIDHPPHYTFSKVEPIDAIEAWNLPFHLGCAVKYIARHEHKGTPIKDLEKARWYIDRYISLIGGKEER